jgi:hypothetical protein
MSGAFLGARRFLLIGTLLLRAILASSRRGRPSRRLHRSDSGVHGWPALLDLLLVFPLLQRRRSLLFFYGFLHESDDFALFG